MFNFSKTSLLALVCSLAPILPAQAQAQGGIEPRLELGELDFASIWQAWLERRQATPRACEGESFPTTKRECLIALAQQGGQVLYTRHVRTETDFADQDDANFDINNCNQQRKVSAEGYQQALVLQRAISEFGIQVRDVISSQFCRAWQTAVPMYGKLDRKSARLNFIQEVECADEGDLQACLDRKAQANLAPLLSNKVGRWISGANRALVGHDDPFKSATGYYPFPMGATYIIKPKGRGEGFDVLGCIAPDAWFGDEPAIPCNLDASLTADDFDEGVPDGSPLGE